MNTDRIVTTDLFLRRTDAKGKSVITHHWTWDAPAFLNNQQREQRNLADQGKAFQIIEPATRDEYRAFAWPTRSK